MPHRILILGGIGSGKSTASDWFAARDAAVISADDVARAVLAPGTEATAKVLSMWPSVGTRGEIDRAALGRIVFADPSELAALEQIVHPATREALMAEIEHHRDHVIVVEMPLIRDWFDDWIAVVVDAPDGIRIDRVVARDPELTRQDVRHVMDRQPSRQEWLLAADYVLDNSSDIEALHRQCAELWERLGSK